jgi:hypothetical protein
VAKSEDALTNPYLIYENMARVMRLINTLNYTGPVAVAGDCTKVRSRLTYCHDYGGHILGSVLPFEETIVENPKEIDAVIAKITKAKAQASQVRAILVKVNFRHFCLLLVDGNGTHRFHYLKFCPKLWRSFPPMAKTIMPPKSWSKI